MLWIKITIILILLIYLFLYIIVHGSARSIDDDMQRRLDEEQARIVSELSNRSSSRVTEQKIPDAEKSGRTVAKTIVQEAIRVPELKKEEGSKETVVVNHSITYRVIKRLFDITLSIIALVLIFPIFIVTAIAIILEDGRPVIFAQERNGLNGSVFRMYKFRSMVKNAPELHASLLKHNELDGPAFKMKDDPRITKVGKFIRKTSIDELPQFINVLKGEMSIVGPRPLPTYEQNKCNDYQNQRMLMKPGLTCYWQVSGRNDVSFDDWIEMDLRYINTANIITDVKVFILTIVAVIKMVGAY